MLGVRRSPSLLSLSHPSALRLTPTDDLSAADAAKACMVVPATVASRVFLSAASTSCSSWTSTFTMKGDRKLCYVLTSRASGRDTV